MSRGVSRIEQRLKSKIEGGEYYEAHQMYRTIASRYKTNKKIEDALKLTYEGAAILYEKDQPGSASDLGILYCTLLDEMDKLTDSILAQIESLHLLTIVKLDEDQPERDQFEKRILQRSIDLSGEKFGSPKVRLIFAKNYFNCAKKTREGAIGTRLLINARGHFQFSNDGKLIAEFLVMYSSFGNDHEVDYFCCQMVVQLLIRKAVETADDFFQSFCTLHPTLNTKQIPYDFPLINFTHFLLCSIREVKADAFLYLKAAYEPLLTAPDPSLRDYVDKIGEMYFGYKRKGVSQDGGGIFGMIQNMMGGMSGGGDDGDSDEEQSSNTSMPNIDMSSIMSMANNMMSGMANQNQSRQPSQRSRQPPPPTPQIADEEVDDLD